MSELCPFCGAYGPRSCDLREDAGCCPWEDAEEEGLSLDDDDLEACSMTTETLPTPSGDGG